MLGTQPPLRGLSSYCLDLALSLCPRLSIEFISFKNLYPAAFYPGKRLEDDHSFPAGRHPHLKVYRRLTWYNPLTWLREGFCIQAELLHAQWWSLPLMPLFWVVCAGFKMRAKPVIITVHNVFPHEKSALYYISARILFLAGRSFCCSQRFCCKTTICLLWHFIPKHQRYSPRPLGFSRQAKYRSEGNPEQDGVYSPTQSHTPFWCDTPL